MKDCSDCVIDECHAAGMSIIEAIKVVRDRCSVRLGAAKQLVTDHPMYEQVAKASEPLHDELERMMDGDSDMMSPIRTCLEAYIAHLKESATDNEETADALDKKEFGKGDWDRGQAVAQSAVASDLQKILDDDG